MSIGKGSLPFPKDLAQQAELAEQFIHADLAGVLSRELALTLAEVALSYAKGHPPEPPADFGGDWDDTDHLNDRSYYD